MQRSSLFIVALISLVLSACTGQDFVKSQAADSLNPQHKASQCPLLARGVWNYNLPATPTAPAASKRYDLLGDSELGFLLRPTGTNDYWIIDGQKHALRDGHTISGYCYAGVVEIDVIDRALSESHIQIQIMPDAHAGQWVETSGGATTRATLSEIPAPATARRPKK